MTDLSCPACGLSQTMRTSRCVRCGANLDGSADAAERAAISALAERRKAEGQLPPADEVDDRTMLRAGLLLPSPHAGPTEASASPWGPTQERQPGVLRRWWQRLAQRLAPRRQVPPPRSQWIGWAAPGQPHQNQPMPPNPSAPNPQQRQHGH